ncbi:peptidase S8/S53 domain-containing protein [Nemania sp. FL0031]|nr:peptidase S8/S53 domain-containing protein [Nemania sp. FL0031]
MQKEVKGVTKAIYSAVNRGKLIFAAAATRGSLQPRAYPACLPGVIAIHATDGYGNPAIFNPSPEEGDNFSVVGMGIKSEWEAQAVFISGTSLATAVAAGIAANILDFGRTHLNKGLDRPGLFYSYPGMRYLLRSMAPLRFQYHFISPWNIFRELSDDDIINPENAWDEVCEKLRNVITQLVALGLPSSLLDSTRIIGSSGPNLISVHEANGREMLEDDVPGQSGLQIKKGKSRKDVNRYIEYLNFLHQHQAIESHKLNDTSKVSSWLLDFLNIDAQVFEPLLKSRAFPRRIKVGVLDTGCDLSTGFFDAEHNHLDKQRITGEHWVDFLNDKIRGPVDEDGHGTKIATTLLMLLPRAEVFIGRVARKRADFSSPDIHETISTAILHAASSWEVDIITMSFGFSEVPSCIEKAIDEAVGPRMRNKRLLIFAAANNSGRNEPERFPASYLRSVISARGTYPNGGFVDDYNPDGSHAPLYGTLAVEVPCTHKWVTKERRPKVLTMSGCSIASPIMASIAATYLQYVLWKMDQLGDEDRRMSQSLHRLFEQDGMLALFSETTRNGGDRRFLAPWQLFEGKGIEKESIWQSRLVAAGSSLHQRVI